MRYCGGVLAVVLAACSGDAGSGAVDARPDACLVPADGTTDSASALPGDARAPADRVALPADSAGSADGPPVPPADTGALPDGPDAPGPADAALPVDCPPLPGDAPPAPADAGPAADITPTPDAAPPPGRWAVRRLFADADGVGAPDGLHRTRDGQVLVTNQINATVGVIDPVAGTYAVAVARFAGLDKPEEVTDGPDGAIYVSDNVRRVVWRVTPEGAEAVAGPADGLVEPKGVVVKDDGTLIVADEGGRQVVAFPPGGEPRVLADVARGLSSPESMHLGLDGALYVTDDHRGGVTRIGPPPDEAVSVFLTPEQLRWSDGVAVAPDGDVWFSEAHPQAGPRVHRYSPAGALRETIAVPGPGEINGIAVLEGDRVLASFYHSPYIASEIWIAEPEGRPEP